MEVIDIFCFSSCKVPADWHTRYNSGSDKLYIFSEPVTMYINKEPTVLEPDTLHYLPASSNAVPIIEKNSGITHIYADFSLSPPIIAPYIFSVSEKQMTQVQKSVLALFKELATIGKETTASRGDLKLFTELVLFLVKTATNRQNFEVVKDEVVLFAIKYMHSDPLGTVTVKNTASALGTTPKTLINRFTKALGITPYAYYKQLRTRIADQMLQRGATFEAAAEYVGYSEAAALIHAMKKQ